MIGLKGNTPSTTQSSGGLLDSLKMGIQNPDNPMDDDTLNQMAKSLRVTGSSDDFQSLVQLGRDRMQQQQNATGPGGFMTQVRNDFSALGDRLAAPYNAMTPDQKSRFQKYSEMAQTRPQQTQFSPVQFGGAGGGANLLSVIDLLKQRGY